MMSGATGPSDPIAHFRALLARAEESEPDVPTAVTLATLGEDGYPAARVVLLKGVDEAGFVFYTNYRSPKGRQLDADPRAALCFHWKTIREQVRVVGDVTRVSAEESDAYFASRPRESCLGAIASAQSEPIASREAFMDRFREVEKAHPEGPVPRPAHWGGYRLTPKTIEFWTHGDHRLHDRFRCERDGDAWRVTRLQP